VSERASERRREREEREERGERDERERERERERVIERARAREREQVRAENERHLAALPGELVTFTAQARTLSNVLVHSRAFFSQAAEIG
jgi:hypothetical protein